MCVGGVCGGESTQCGDGTTDGGCNEECDDGNNIGHDGCSPTCQAEFVCPPTPDIGCRAPVLSGKASFQVTDKSPDSKDRLQWKWLKGAATTVAEFGAPLTTTDYVLCIYDNGAFLGKTRIPAGGDCLGKPCWKAKSTGFQYKDKGLDPDGISQLDLKAGVDGKAKIQIKGSRDNLPTLTPAFTLPMRVQLRNSSGTCWEATYSAPAIKNVAGSYKDKAD
jgi:cysteine-rich repeat protein